MLRLCLGKEMGSRWAEHGGQGGCIASVVAAGITASVKLIVPGSGKTGSFGAGDANLLHGISPWFLFARGGCSLAVPARSFVTAISPVWVVFFAVVVRIVGKGSRSESPVLLRSLIQI
jgi:hypothetical protein